MAEEFKNSFGSNISKVQLYQSEIVKSEATKNFQILWFVASNSLNDSFGGKQDNFETFSGPLPSRMQTASQNKQTHQFYEYFLIRILKGVVSGI
jgi:hypothetical protein